MPGRNRLPQSDQNIKGADEFAEWRDQRNKYHDHREHRHAGRVDKFYRPRKQTSAMRDTGGFAFISVVAHMMDSSANAPTVRAILCCGEWERNQCKVVGHRVHRALIPHLKGNLMEKSPHPRHSMSSACAAGPSWASSLILPRDLASNADANASAKPGQGQRSPLPPRIARRAPVEPQRNGNSATPAPTAL